MTSWLVATVPGLIGMLIGTAIRSRRQRDSGGAIASGPTIAQIYQKRDIDLEKRLTRLRPNRWYDHAIGIALLLTPLSQWIGYQYWGNFLSIALPLIVYVILHLLNSFDPPRIPREPTKSGKIIKIILWICGLASILALMTSLPPLPEIIVIQVTLFDVIGLLISGLVSLRIYKSNGLWERR